MFFYSSAYWDRGLVGENSVFWELLSHGRNNPGTLYGCAIEENRIDYNELNRIDYNELN